MLYTYRVTKYDPDDRDEHGRYLGAEDTDSDHGAVESAYLRAVAAFADDAGVDRLAIREPQIAAVDAHGLAGLFPPDLAGFHDGAEIPIAVGLELVRAMLRDNGAWCRLEVEDVFTVHVGWDQYTRVVRRAAHGVPLRCGSRRRTRRATTGRQHFLDPASSAPRYA